MSHAQDAGDAHTIARSDLIAAWSVLENLAVSLDQIGGTFGEGEAVRPGPQQRRALEEALRAYLTPSLVKTIQDARNRLAPYIPDEEAEALSGQIPYWDYSTLPANHELQHKPPDSRLKT